LENRAPATACACIESQSLTERSGYNNKAQPTGLLPIALQYSAGEKIDWGKKGLRRDEQIAWTAVWVFRFLPYSSASEEIFLELTIYMFGSAAGLKFSPVIFGYPLGILNIA
jgi:hypothetical protein